MSKYPAIIPIEIKFYFVVNKQIYSLNHEFLCGRSIPTSF